MWFVNVCCDGVSLTCHAFVVESGQGGGEVAEEFTQGPSPLYSVFSFNIEPGSLCTKTSGKGSRGWDYSTRYHVHKFGPNSRISKGSIGLTVTSPHPTAVELAAEMFCCPVDGPDALLCTYPIRPSRWTEEKAPAHLLLLPAVYLHGREPQGLL